MYIYLSTMLTDKLVSTNAQENGKLEEEIKEIRKILDEIKLIKNTHEIELHKRDSVINKLRTRINVLENEVSIGKIKMEHYEVKVDNNEQYSRRHSIRLTGIEKKKQKETPDDIMGKIYEEKWN